MFGFLMAACLVLSLASFFGWGSVGLSLFFLALALSLMTVFELLWKRFEADEPEEKENQK